MLPPDWREQFVDMIRGARPLDGAWFGGGPALSPLEQIGIYREQFRLRLGDAVREEIPGLAALLGDDVDDVIAAYLADHPPTSWTLNRVADRLADWLAARGAPAAQVEMARLDNAVQRGFEAANGVTLRPENLGDDPVLGWQPPVSLLHLTHTVHHVRAEIIAGRPPPEPEAKDVWLVVFRRGLRMRHLQLEAPAWALLAELREPSTVSAALARWMETVEEPEAHLGRLQEWFRLFAEHDLVQVAR